MSVWADSPGAFSAREGIRILGTRHRKHRRPHCLAVQRCLEERQRWGGQVQPGWTLKAVEGRARAGWGSAWLAMNHSMEQDWWIGEEQMLDLGWAVFPVGAGEG